MNSLATSFRSALGFLTVVPGARAPTPGALRWFAPVGATVGAAVGVAGVEARAWWPALVAATTAVIVDAVVTGGLHLDGLADSADGLLPPVDRPRRLTIMSTPEIGAFGATALVLVLLLRVSSLAAVTSAVTVAAVWATSRSVASLVVLHVPYARGGGLAAAFRDDQATSTTTVVNVVSIGVAAAVATAVVGLTAGIAVAATVGASAAVIRLGTVRLGGFTGDVLGAAIVIGETVGLVVAAAS